MFIIMVILQYMIYWAEKCTKLNLKEIIFIKFMYLNILLVYIMLILNTMKNTIIKNLLLLNKKIVF